MASAKKKVKGRKKQSKKMKKSDGQKKNKRKKVKNGDVVRKSKHSLKCEWCGAEQPEKIGLNAEMYIEGETVNFKFIGLTVHFENSAALAQEFVRGILVYKKQLDQTIHNSRVIIHEPCAEWIFDEIHRYPKGELGLDDMDEQAVRECLPAMALDVLQGIYHKFEWYAFGRLGFPDDKKKNCSSVESRNFKEGRR